MRKNIKFLKAASLIVKIVAWIFLLLGFFSGLSIVLGALPDYPRWMGLIIIACYAFLFFFLIFAAKVSDTLVNLIKEIER